MSLGHSSADDVAEPDGDGGVYEEDARANLTDGVEECAVDDPEVTRR
jgi:hypothetical protein